MKVNGEKQEARLLTVLQHFKYGVYEGMKNWNWSNPGVTWYGLLKI